MFSRSRKRVGPNPLLLAGLLCLTFAPVFAQDDESDWPAWADQEEALRERAVQVNEGDLRFLAKTGDDPVHHHSNHITIGEQSLLDGWVLLEQCHTHLDRVPELQIVFNAERTKALEVTHVHNIGEAFAQGHTVQLRDIGAASRICVRTESRALHLHGKGEFELRNGPFMRRFLDGYYPLRLSMRVDYPDSLQLADFAPAAQPGFTPVGDPGWVAVDTLFEGRLHTSFRFLAR